MLSARSLMATPRWFRSFRAAGPVLMAWILGWTHSSTTRCTFKFDRLSRRAIAFGMLLALLLRTGSIQIRTRWLHSWAATTFPDSWAKGAPASPGWSLLRL